MRTAVRTEGLTVSYMEGAVPVLDGLDLVVNEGEHVGVIGRSGSGKSTLLNVLSGLVPRRIRSMVEGRVEVCGLPLPERYAEVARRLGVVFQAPEEMFVSEIVIDEMAFSLKAQGRGWAEAVKRCTKVAGALGIEGTLERRTRDLSGGEKQLLAIASQVVTDPRLLLLDEPSSQLDPAGKGRLARVVGKLRSEMPGMAIVQIEHELEQLSCTDRVIVLDRGRLVADGPPEEVLTDRGCLESAGLGQPPLLDVVSTTIEMGMMGPVPKRFIGVPVILWDSMSELGLEVPGPSLRRNRRSGTLRLEGVRFRYPGDPSVIKGLDLDLSGSSSVALMGKNGAGKSTLGKLIAGLLEPDAGSIDREGECFYLFQRPGNMFFSGSVRSELDGVPGRERLLAELGLEALSDRDPTLLSEGEKQRLGLALALGSGADLLVLDEPFKALDRPMLERALGLLGRKGVGAHIIITNDPGTAARCEEVVIISNGRVISRGHPDEVLCSAEVMRSLGWAVPAACVISRRSGCRVTSDMGRIGKALRVVGG